MRILLKFGLSCTLIFSMLAFCVGIAWASNDIESSQIDAGIKEPIALELRQADSAAVSRASAIFAGGCFWCMESPYDKLEGVLSTTSGYTGGQLKNPSYKQVSAGNSGHIEALQVVYDPSKITYQQLLEVFWINIDPLDGGGQFCDRGSQYTAAIFYADDLQRQGAQDSLVALVDTAMFEQPIQTKIIAASQFYPAESYHQNYYQRNPVRYKYYRWNCGRDQRLQALWGKKSASQQH